MNITYHDIFGYIAGFLMIVGMYPYVRSIVITRKTELNRSSWIIWSSIGIINLLAYIAAGEKETLWFVIIAGINPTILFLLSLKYGVQKWLRSDTACLILAVIAIVLWKATGNPVLALVAGLSADALGIIPTFLKILEKPFTEDLIAWTIGLTASACNVIAVKDWTWANAMYTGYSVLGFGLIVITLVIGQHFRRTASE